MRTATTIEVSRDSRHVIEFACEAENLGLDICWVAEAWGSDAPSVLGYLTARTQRMLLGSGIIQLGTRTPVAIAQAALTLADISDGRFLLGLGASGPQVVEGLHGVSFARALTRMRETIAIIRQTCTGAKISFQGDAFRIPLDDSSKPMRLSLPANTDIPIYIASLSPMMLKLTGEVADGWLGTSFVPEGSHAYFDHIDAGLTAAGRTRSDLDVCQGAEVAFFDDEQALIDHIASRKRELAFSIGGMGSEKKNFYNAAYARQGWAHVTDEIWQHWQAGDHRGAASLVTDDMVLATTLIGTRKMVTERLRIWQDAGVDTVRLYPAGDSLDGKLANLAQAIDIVRELDQATPIPHGAPTMR